MECNKCGLLFITYILLQMTGLIKGTNVDCNGKAYHCTNSTHFKICVDLGGGVSKTVDEFLIPCPPFTFCKETNYFECEYEVTTTYASTNQHDVVKNEVTQSTDVDNVLDINPIIPLPYINKGVMSERLYSAVKTTYRYETEKETPSEIRTIPTLIANHVNESNNNTKNVSTVEADSQINIPLSAEFLTTTDNTFNDIKPAYLSVNNMDMQYATEQPSITEVATSLSFSALESDYINTLNPSTVENTLTTTTINLNPDVNKADTPANIQLYGTLINTEYFTSASFANNHGADKMESTRNNISTTIMDFNNLTEEIPTKNMNQTVYTTDKQILSSNIITYTTESYKETELLSYFTDSKFKHDLDTTMKFASMDDSTAKVPTPLKIEDNDYTVNFYTTISLAQKDATSANDIGELLLDRNKIIPTNTNNSNYQNFHNTIETTTASYHITNNDIFTATFNESMLLTNKHFDIAVSNETKLIMQESKKKNNSDTDTIAALSLNNSINPKFISKTTSPVLKETMEIRAVPFVDTNTPYSSKLEISTQKYSQSAVSAVEDNELKMTSLKSSSQNKTDLNLSDDNMNNHTYFFQDASNIDESFAYLNKSMQASEIKATTHTSKLNKTKDQMATTVGNFLSTTGIYKTVSNNYPMNNEESSKTSTNVNQEMTKADNQSKHKKLSSQSELHPIAGLTSENANNSFLFTEHEIMRNKKNITNDTHNLPTSDHLNIQNDMMKREVESRNAIRELSVEPFTIAGSLQDITTDLSNLNTPSTYVTHYFSEIEASTEKYLDSSLILGKDYLPTTTPQTYETSKIKGFINTSMKPISDYSNQNKSHLDINDNYLIKEEKRNTELTSTSTEYDQSANLTPFSTKSPGSQNYELKPDYTINYEKNNSGNISTNTNGDEEQKEPIYKLMPIKTSNRTAHLNQYQSVLDPIKLLLSENYSYSSFDSEQTPPPGTKNITNDTNIIASLNNSSFLTENGNDTKTVDIGNELSVQEHNLLSITSIPLENKSTEFNFVHIPELEVNDTKYTDYAVTTGIDIVLTNTTKISLTKETPNRKIDEHVTDHGIEAVSLKVNKDTAKSQIYRTSEIPGLIDTSEQIKIESSSKNMIDPNMTEIKFPILNHTIQTFTQPQTFESGNHTSTLKKFSYSTPTSDFAEVTGMKTEFVTTKTKAMSDPIKLNFSSHFSTTESHKNQSNNKVINNTEPTEPNLTTLSNTQQNSDNARLTHLEIVQHTTTKSMMLSLPILDIKLNTTNIPESKFKLYKQIDMNLNEQKYKSKLTSSNLNVYLETSTFSPNSYSPDNILIDNNLDTTSNLKKELLENAELYSTTENELMPIFNNIHKIDGYTATPIYKDSKITTRTEIPSANINIQNINEYTDITTDRISTSLNFPTQNKIETKTENYYTQKATHFFSIQNDLTKLVPVPKRQINVRNIEETINTTMNTNTNIRSNYKDLNIPTTTEYVAVKGVGTSRVVVKEIENHENTFKSKEIINKSNLLNTSTNLSDREIQARKELPSIYINNNQYINSTSDRLKIITPNKHQTKVDDVQIQKAFNFISINDSYLKPNVPVQLPERQNTEQNFEVTTNTVLNTNNIKIIKYITPKETSTTQVVSKLIEKHNNTYKSKDILNTSHPVNISIDNPNSGIKAKKELFMTNLNLNNTEKRLTITTNSTITPLSQLAPNENKTKTERFYTQTESSLLTIKYGYLKPTIPYELENKKDKHDFKVVTDTILETNGENNFKDLNIPSTTEYIYTQATGTSHVVDKQMASTSHPFNTYMHQLDLITKKGHELVKLQIKDNLKIMSNESQVRPIKLKPYFITSLSDTSITPNKPTIKSTTTPTPSVYNHNINEKQSKRFFNSDPIKSLGLNHHNGTYNKTQPIINDKYSNYSHSLKKQTIKTNKSSPEFQPTERTTKPMPKITQNSMLGIMCVKHNRGKYSDRHNCRKFYICVGEIQPLIGECPVNTVFSEITKQCTKNLSHCIRNNKFQCVSSGRFYDVFLVNTYYICVPSKNGYVKFKFQCINGYSLNKTSVRCIEDYKDVHTSVSDSSSTSEGSRSNENNSERAVSKAFECESAGKFADPNDCRKYYICSRNNKSEFRRKNRKCDSDEVWHREKKKCVDDDSYECKLT